jgi:hypothetical protein
VLAFLSSVDKEGQNEKKFGIVNDITSTTNISNDQFSEITDLEAGNTGKDTRYIFIECLAAECGFQEISCYREHRIMKKDSSVSIYAEDSSFNYGDELALKKDQNISRYYNDGSSTQTCTTGMQSVDSDASNIRITIDFNKAYPIGGISLIGAQNMEYSSLFPTDESSSYINSVALYDTSIGSSAEYCTMDNSVYGADCPNTRDNDRMIIRLSRSKAENALEPNLCGILIF